jgi:hypothetical protein
MPTDARTRLDSALAGTGARTAGDHAALIAKRDTLLDVARDLA